MVPDLCTVNVDIRLTPALDDPAAAALVQEAVASTDAAWPGTPPTDSTSPLAGRPMPCRTARRCAAPC